MPGQCGFAAIYQPYAYRIMNSVHMSDLSKCVCGCLHVQRQAPLRLRWRVFGELRHRPHGRQPCSRQTLIRRYLGRWCRRWLRASGVSKLCTVQWGRGRPSTRPPPRQRCALPCMQAPRVSMRLGTCQLSMDCRRNHLPSAVCLQTCRQKRSSCRQTHSHSMPSGHQ